MKDFLIERPVTREALEEATTPARAHGVMTSWLPQLHGRTGAIRAASATQFRVDLPTDPLGAPGVIRWRVRSDALEDGAGTPVAISDLVDGVRILAVVAAERRGRDDVGKVKTRPVNDDEATAWGAALLGRHGLATDDLEISPAQQYGRRGPHFWIRHLAATIAITDFDLATRAMHAGIGRGRAYGLGLVVPDPTHL